MVVMASAMPFAAGLLPTCAWRLVVVAMRIGRLGGGGGFGFSSVASAFQLPEFRLQELHLFFPFGLALDGTLMLGLPVVRLQAQFDELSPQMTAEDQEQNEEKGELAKTSPEPDQDSTKVGLRIVENNRRGDRAQRSLLGSKNNQRKGIGVHALSS